MDSVHTTRRPFATVSVLVPGICAALLAAALVLPMPAAFAQATGGAGTEPCTQNPGSQDIACGTGSSVSTAGQPGSRPGWIHSAGGAGGTANTAIGGGAQAGNGGDGANSTAGGVAGVGGAGGSRNIAIGENSQAGQGGNGGDGSAGGRGGTGGVGGNDNIALGNNSVAGSGGDGISACCGWNPGAGTAGTSGNTALGNGASATGGNSVALGAGSDDDGEANVVSVGSAASPAPRDPRRCGHRRERRGQCFADEQWQRRDPGVGQRLCRCP